MSWLQKLYETYESCKGFEPQGSERLIPISHTTQHAHIEIVLDGKGHFRRAQVVEKSLARTVIPCTEKSGGRTGKKPVNHPLCDKLQYLAGDYLQYGGKVTSGFADDSVQPHRDYLCSLRAWAESKNGHPKLDSILIYVQQGKVVADLVDCGVLYIDQNTKKLLREWPDDKGPEPKIYKVLAKDQFQEDAFVRWRVELNDDDPQSATWNDENLISSWIEYYQSLQKGCGYCMVTGQETILALQHPAKLRHDADTAKLISANDGTTGYTYRGKFIDSKQAVGVGFVVSQKAHNALRWLIARQGHSSGTQVFVAWELAGKPMPDPFASTFNMFGGESADWIFNDSHTNAGQAFALKLKKAIAGYHAQLDPKDQVTVMGLDSVTTGRMAIIYYRELKGSEFLSRIETWHSEFAWAQNFGKDCKFIGAPSPYDIAEAVYGKKLDKKIDNKLYSAIVESLLPCIVDGVSFPIGLLKAVMHRASNRFGLDSQEWEKYLGIACAVFKGFHTERRYLMALEQERTSRDYLFGRLLAIAEKIEDCALSVANEEGSTAAARLMQRFADRPFSTWKTIELSLQPYMTRLRNNRPGFLHNMLKQMDDVMAAFLVDDFVQDTALSGEFLIGYHCQRQALRSSNKASEDKTTVDESNLEKII